MESTRPIRALVRGLEALTVLNVRDGATVSEVAHEIRLPRTTVYRILETVCLSGFVFRDPRDDRYRLTPRVRTLSEGFEDEAWVNRIAKPLIQDLGNELVWPVSIATLSGTTLMIRDSTDHVSPLANERYSAGFRLPLLTSAAGRCYLAFCPPAQREPLIDALARSGKEEDRAARGPRADLQRLLGEIKLQGHAVTSRARRLFEEISLSVPLVRAERVFACLTVRFSSSMLPHKSGVERLLPRLKHCAAKLGTAFDDVSAGEQRAPAPQPVS